MSARARQHTHHDDSYLRETLKPLYCLVFVLPILLFFHWGTRNYSMGLLAEHDLRKVLSYFGGTAACLPPLAVISVLLAQHLLRRDRWDLRLRVIGGMCVESVLWIVPLMAVSHVITRMFLTATQPASAGCLDSILIGVGGGIYEEFVFHLLAIGLFMLIFVDAFALPKTQVAISAVVVCAVLFGLFHTNVPPFYGSEAFSGEAFAFRILAGLYLGAIFILRGFGIAVGTHIMWNIYVVYVI
jgi:hypothetical protein